MFFIDPMSRTPIYEQIRSQLESLILAGILREGDRIPSVRSLSVELSVTPVTVLKAFAELDSSHIISSVPGRGYFVCEGAREALSAQRRALLDEVERISKQLAAASIDIEDVLSRVRLAYDSNKRKEESK